MQEKFIKSCAATAANIFNSFITNSELKSTINNSNKTLIVLTMMAYLGECSKTKLKKAIPVLNLDTCIDELVALNLISKTREGKEVFLKYKGGSDSTKPYSEDTLYLFANTLLNISLYIKKYDISSWNLLAFMLEMALNATYVKQRSLIHLDEETILSVSGSSSNKLMARKKLENMGVIKPADFTKKRSYGGDFVLNRRAFIIEVK